MSLRDVIAAAIRAHVFDDDAAALIGQSILAPENRAALLEALLEEGVLEQPTHTQPRETEPFETVTYRAVWTRNGRPHLTVLDIASDVPLYRFLDGSEK